MLHHYRGSRALGCRCRRHGGRHGEAVGSESENQQGFKEQVGQERAVCCALLNFLFSPLIACLRRKCLCRLVLFALDFIPLKLGRFTTSIYFSFSVIFRSMIREIGSDIQAEAQVLSKGRRPPAKVAE